MSALFNSHRSSCPWKQTYWLDPQREVKAAKSPLVQFPLQTTWILGFPHPVHVDLRAGAARCSGPLPELLQQRRRQAAAGAQSSAPPQHAPSQSLQNMQQELAQIPQMRHYTFPSSLVIRAEVCHSLRFITNTKFHWQQRTAEICHNKNVIIMLIYHNHDKHKGKKVKKLEFPLFPHALKCFSLDWLLRSTRSCPRPDLRLLQ